LPREVAYYILNKKREDLLEIESKREVSIAIEIDPELVPGQSRISNNVQ
jgi:ribonuclease E